MATQLHLRIADLDSMLKTQLIYGLPTSGLKSSLIARLLTLRSQLRSLPASSAATNNAGWIRADRLHQPARDTHRLWFTLRWHPADASGVHSGWPWPAAI